MRNALAALALVAISAGCSSIARGASPGAVSQWSAEDSIHFTLLRPFAGQDTVLLLVDEETKGVFGPASDPTGLNRIQLRFIEDLPQDLVADFRAKLTGEQISVGTNMLATLAPAVQLSSSYDSTAVVENDGLYRAPSNKRIFRMHFSRVGFDTERMYALVYSYFGCGQRCGDISLHLLRKDDEGVWRVERSSPSARL